LSRRAVPGQYPGAPGGNRGAPPRGVDVKQPLRPLPRGGEPPGDLPGGPGRGPRDPGIPDPASRSRRPPGGLPSPPGGLGGPCPGSRRAPRTGFYINPSRRPPAVPGRVPGSPAGPGVPGSPGEASGGREVAPARRGTARTLRDPGPAPGNRGAPARGVDVKPPSPGPEKGPFGARDPKKPFLGFLGLFPGFLTEILVSFGPFLRKRGKYPQNAHFWAFLTFFGLFRPFSAKNPDFRGFRGPEGSLLHQPLAAPPRGSPGAPGELRGGGPPMGYPEPGKGLAASLWAARSRPAPSR